MSAQENAAGMLDTSATADIKLCSAIVASPETDGKNYATLQAEFAILGHTLNHSRSSDGGEVSFIVARWNQARFFKHLNDVRAFLAQVSHGRRI